MKTSGYVVTSDQHKIYYDLYNGGHQKVIIIAHGFFNSKQALLFIQMAEELSHEFNVIVFDFRGHGSSEGLFCWTSREYRDLQAVVEFAAERYQRIGVVGFSLGAATSIITAVKTVLINSLVAVSPPADVGKIDYKLSKFDYRNDVLFGFLGKGRKGKGVRPGPFWEAKQRPLDVVRALKIPVLYIHGENDWVINHWHSVELYRHTASSKRLHLVRHGPHAEYLFKEKRGELMATIVSWFRETL